MRLWMILVVICAMLVSCGTDEQINRLAYQENALTVEADFTIDGEVIPVKLKLEAPEFDEYGVMLARDALLVVGENSIISGVSFEVSGGEMYVSSGELRIPLEDPRAVSGINSILSLFCISQNCFYSAEEITDGGKKLDSAVYVNGDNRVSVLTDMETGMPVRISAIIGERELIAEIHSVSINEIG